MQEAVLRGPRYAMALRVPERCARAFEGIYQEAPRWYVSEGGVGTFRPAAFHHRSGASRMETKTTSGGLMA